MPLKKKKTRNQSKKKKTLNRLLETLYYESQRPSSLGGVDNLYRAARQYGITRSQVLTWLQQQPGYTLHRPARRRFRRNKVFVNGLDDQWQADLVDLQSLSRWNHGYKYLLTCIDILSKYAWVVPLKTKTGSALVEAFTKIFRQGRKPDKLQTDAGTEFKNKTFQTFLKQHDVHYFVTYNETKAQIVERFNRTLKQMMWRLFTTSSSYHYLDKLNNLVNDNYNHTMHRSIKMKPSEVTVMNAQQVWRTLYGKRSSTIKYKFKIGDQVKISKHKRVFEKSYLPNWSEETFTVAQRLPRDPPVYRLKEHDGELIQGTFYETELQKVIEPLHHLFRVDKVLRRRGQGAQAEVLVHWKGWPKKYDSWIPARQLVSLQ
nr:TPA_asm: integrase [Rhodactis coral adintovirus]